MCIGIHVHAELTMHLRLVLCKKTHIPETVLSTLNNTHLWWLASLVVPLVAFPDQLILIALIYCKG